MQFMVLFKIQSFQLTQLFLRALWTFVAILENLPLYADHSQKRSAIFDIMCSAHRVRPAPICTDLFRSIIWKFFWIIWSSLRKWKPGIKGWTVKTKSFKARKNCEPWTLTPSPLIFSDDISSMETRTQRKNSLNFSALIFLKGSWRTNGPNLLVGVEMVSWRLWSIVRAPMAIPTFVFGLISCSSIRWAKTFQWSWL